MKDIALICDLLENAFGRPDWVRHNPPLEELVLTILSQNTTSGNCRLAFGSLMAAFPSWEQVMAADAADIATAIRSGGLADIKAERIKRILQQIHEQQGSLDLDWLESSSMEEATGYLLQFEGVGPKTAACVLLFSLMKPAMPVDTHVHRVALRVGLIPARTNANAAHKLLLEMVPPERAYSFHMNTVRLGREICRPSSPKCEKCILNRECDFGRKRLGID